MNELMRNEIIHRWRQGMSQRNIGAELNVSRGAVARTISAHLAAREDEGPPSSDETVAVGESPATARRPSQLDAFDEQIRQWLARYPKLTAVRLLEELRAAGFRGGYSILKERVRELRGPQAPPLVERFETLPGRQAQMDWATYTINFVDEGRRRVNCFSYVLGYSRRQYIRFTEYQDLPTLQREHVRAFEHLGGVAATCLYDNQKAVVTKWEDDAPLFNTQFLAFATHYGFRPIACRPLRPQTKGKVERPFQYIETNLLNGREFRGLEHLNELAAWWLENVADVRVHRETQKTPRDAHAEERPHLLPLPARPYDTALVVYRVVDAEGCIGYERNRYSVPWQLVGQMLPVHVQERELIVHDSEFREIARHPLFPRDQNGQRSILPAHRPSEARQPREDLRQRFVALGEVAVRFYDGLLRQQPQAQHHARQTLALLGLYRAADLVAAMERAVRYHAFDWKSLERILAATAKPRPAHEALADSYTTPLMGDPIPPRSTAEYQQLLFDAPVEPTVPCVPPESPHEPPLTDQEIVPDEPTPEPTDQPGPRPDAGPAE
jgi:transposase